MKESETPEVQAARSWAPERMVVIVAAIALAWVVFSDALLYRLVGGRASLTALVLGKDVVFVLLVAVFFRWVVRRDAAQRGVLETALRQGLERYRGLIEAMNDGVAIRDANEVLTLVNDRFCDLVGRPREEMLSRRLTEFLDEANRKVLHQESDRRRRGEKRTYELALSRRDGRRVSVLVSPQPMFDEQGGFRGTLGVFTDITDRKEAEAALRESEERYRTLVESQVEAVCRWLPDTTLTFVNEGYCRLFGKTRKELQGTRWIGSVPEDSRESVLKFYADVAVQESPSPQTYEHTVVDAAGQTRWIRWTDLPVLDAEGRLQEFQSVGHDVTDRKRAESELERERDFVAAVLETAGALVTVLDVKGRIVSFNRACEEVTGYAFKEIRGRRFWDVLLSGEERDSAKQVFDDLVSGHFPSRHESYWMGKDGRRRLISWSNTALVDGSGAVEYVIATGIDITERKEAEEALRLTKFSVDRAPVAVYWIDPQGRLVYGNETACRWLGYTPEELSHLSVFDIDPDCTAEKWSTFWQKLKERGSIVYDWRNRTKSGRVLPVAIAANYFTVGDKEYEFAFVHDLTERRQAEEALREREETLRLLFEHVNDGINVAEYDVTTGKRRLVSCNHRYVEMSGRSREELMGSEDLNALMDYPHTRAERQRWLELMKEGVAFQGFGSWRRPDGRENYIEWTAAPAPRGDKIMIFGVDRDITERRRAEAEKARLADQMLQAQKLEALGTLAGGVAHDFNNLLTGILGYASLLKMDAPSRSETHEEIEAIERAAQRAAQLTGQLLAFARRGRRENIPVDMHQVIVELSRLLERTLGEGIEFRQELRAPSHAVVGDPGRLEQVLFNLAINARDAMPEGGALVIGTEVVSLQDGDRRAHDGLGPGRYLLVSVSDTGSGIPKEIRDRIFEPFFTTKEPGKGTGLGLALVYGVVRDHDGTVQVYSEEGRGTTFRVYLPLAEASAGRRRRAPAMTPVRGSGRILLVDDDEIVRSTASSILKELGYEVEATDDCRAAIEQFRQGTDRADLVILDLVMAEMNGLECLREIRAIKPSVAALLSSGRGLSEEGERSVAEMGVEFIQKPYNVQQLSQAVSRALHRGEGAA